MHLTWRYSCSLSIGTVPKDTVSMDCIHFHACVLRILTVRFSEDGTKWRFCVAGVTSWTDESTEGRLISTCAALGNTKQSVLPVRYWYGTIASAKVSTGRCMYRRWEEGRAEERGSIQRSRLTLNSLRRSKICGIYKTGKGNRMERIDIILKQWKIYSILK